MFGRPRLKHASLARSRRRGHEAVAALTRRAWLVAVASGLGGLVAACSMNLGDFGMSLRPAPAQQQPAAAIGSGEVKAALILPLSAAGGIGLAAQSLKNAAEMALAEYNAPNVQLLLKDDGGTVQGAQAAAQQALDEGAEIILGPLLAPSVTAVGQVARPRGVPVIAFSTDTNVAARGVYLLSLLPESEVDRIVAYAASQGRRAYAALIPENAYGTVVQAALQQSTARRGARVVVLERYGQDPQQMQAAIARVAQAVAQMDAVFIPDETDSVAVVQGLTAAGVNTRRIQPLGTRLWSDNPQIASNPALQGAWYAGPDPAGFRGFATRYRSRFGRDPIGRAEVAYDAVSLVSALVKTQGAQRFTEQVLTNPSGFSGVDGIFRFRQDGVNERGLAVLRVGPAGGTVISSAPKSFSGSGT